MRRLLVAVGLTAILAIGVAVYPDVDPNAATIKRTLLVVAIAVLTLEASRAAALFLGAFARERPERLPAASLLATVLRILAIVTGVMLALEVLGISVTPILGALGVSGLAVALALQPTLASLIAGIFILASRQLRTGDYVRFDPYEGIVVDISWRTTTIRDGSGNNIVLPNETVVRATFTNAAREGLQNITLPFAVLVANDIAAVQNVALSVADPSYEPRVRMLESTDTLVRLALILSVPRSGDPLGVRDAIFPRLHAALRDAQIKPFA